MIDNTVNKRGVYRLCDSKAMQNYHKHRGFEIFQIWSENATVLIDDKIYDVTPGDVFYLNATCFHYVKAGDLYTRSAITFSPHDIPSDKSRLLDIFIVKDVNTIIKAAKELTWKFDSMFKHYSDELKGCKSHADAMAQSILIQILVTLNRSLDNAHSKGDIGHSSHIKKALEYINQNLSNKITLLDIANNININKDYLSHLFKEQTGFTVAGYLNSRRLYNARDILLGSDNTIEEIAIKCGFSGYSSFSQSFKSMFGKSPFNYRKNQI